MADDDVFPDRSMAEREKVAWMVEENGWALVPVAPRYDTTPPVPGYSYTVGLTSSFGFPEVVVFGLTPVAARGIVDDVVGIVRTDSTSVPVGEVFTGLYDNELRSALVPLDANDISGIFPAADAWHGSTPYDVVQLVWPDRNGWLPWEPGFDRALTAAQPVLGTIEA
jgi:Domain of unknown function (DUF4262)